MRFHLTQKQNSLNLKISSEQKKIEDRKNVKHFKNTESIESVHPKSDRNVRNFRS